PVFGIVSLRSLSALSVSAVNFARKKNGSPQRRRERRDRADFSFPSGLLQAESWLDPSRESVIPLIIYNPSCISISRMRVVSFNNSESDVGSPRATLSQRQSNSESSRSSSFERREAALASF